jgi:phosphoglycerol transferase
MIGGVGFMVMLSWTLFVRAGNRHRTLIDALATMNLAVVLLATTGGFGMIFNLLVHPQIRAYNRASVFIAFFALTTVAMGLDWLDRRCATARSRTVFGVSMILLLVAGILDQSSFEMLPVPSWEGPYRKQFHADAEFVACIEAALPAGAAVYQLPYTTYPDEASYVHLMGPYEHHRPYLHSRSLRFSHGAMRGREADRWHQAIQGLPLDAFLDAITKAGFQAIYIDRRGYPDRAKQLENELRNRFQSEPLEDRAGDRVCFILSPTQQVAPKVRNRLARGNAPGIVAVP